jgi:hypothetical protein
MVAWKQSVLGEGCPVIAWRDKWKFSSESVEGGEVELEWRSGDGSLVVGSARRS